MFVAAGVMSPVFPSAPSDRFSDLNINILIEGQSNAGLFLAYGGGAILSGRVASLLGFRGRQSVTVLGGADRTMWSGVALIRAAPGATAWLTPGPSGVWQDTVLQKTFTSYVSGLPAPLRSSPTVTVWLHNETDSANPNLQQGEWESAIRHTVEEEREALAQTPATTPIDFVYVPADCPTRCLEVSGAWRKVQMLKAGFEDLVSDATFNARVGAQIGDADMDGVSAQMGGLHMDRQDVQTLAERLSLTIANQLWPYAQPGSAAHTAHGSLPCAGPAAISASRVDPRRVVVSVALEPGSAGLQALSPSASHGAGWELVSGSTLLHGVAVSVSGRRIFITFNNDLPESGGTRLYYGWGSGRIAAYDAVSPPPARGAAIYDEHGLPLWVKASGLPVEVSERPGIGIRAE